MQINYKNLYTYLLGFLLSDPAQAVREIEPAFILHLFGVQDLDELRKNWHRVDHSKLPAVCLSLGANCFYVKYRLDYLVDRLYLHICATVLEDKANLTALKGTTTYAFAPTALAALRNCLPQEVMQVTYSRLVKTPLLQDAAIALNPTTQTITVTI